MQSKKKQPDSFQELIDMTNSEIEQLQNLTGEDFKDGVIKALKGCVESIVISAEYGVEQRNIIIETFQEAIKNIDLAFERFVKFQEKVENFRYYLLFHTAQTEYMYKKLVEKGIIQDQTEELNNITWSDEHVSMMGFDQGAEEIKKRIIESLKEPGEEVPNQRSKKVSFLSRYKQKQAREHKRKINPRGYPV